MTSNIIFTLCTMLFIMSSVALVLVILVQKPQGGGLSAAFGAGGGGASQTAFGTKTGDMLTLGTVGLFVFFIAISITLVLLSGARYGSRSGLPNPPSNLVAIAQSHNSVKVTWSDESNNESRFTIERALSADAEDDAWFEIWSTVDNIEIFDDSSVLPDTTYFYRVFSSNGSGNSDPTEVAQAATLAAPGTTPIGGIEPESNDTVPTIDNPVIGGGEDDGTNNPQPPPTTGDPEAEAEDADGDKSENDGTDKPSTTSDGG